MDYVVKFEDVYKEYPFYQHLSAGFKSFVFNLPKSIASLKKSRFIALKGVSFEVKKGETFGIIGRNGSGKSTILGLIAGVIKQDRGVIETKGRISSLLELGAGFHPDLSGIENIILNGILTGNTREDMLKKMDRIIEFSEIGDFIYQPLRTYSSGMYVRLGFSMAVHIEPEILLVDEALAVGDRGFQEKCLKRMQEFKESGTTIIIVSHDMAPIEKLCDKVAWIEGGRIIETGEPKEVVEKYLASLNKDFSPIYKDYPALEIEEPFISDEQAISPDNGKVSEVPGSLSWWDSPLIIRQCEESITGSPDLHFYDFLRRQYSIQNLEKGLCICNKLKGIEANFISYGICKSFDVLEDENRITDLLSGRSGLQEQQYDLFLCIDVLSHIAPLDLFIEKINHILKDKGFIIAMEYVGPVNFQWSDKDIEIADTIYKALNNGIIATKPPLSISSYLYPIDGQGAVSSNRVIPLIERVFDMVTVRYFGNPLYDLLINKIIDRLDVNEAKDAAILRLIIQTGQVLVQKGILENNYVLIIARRRSVT